MGLVWASFAGLWHVVNGDFHSTIGAFVLLCVTMTVVARRLGRKLDRATAMYEQMSKLLIFENERYRRAAKALIDVAGEDAASALFEEEEDVP